MSNIEQGSSGSNGSDSKMKLLKAQKNPVVCGSLNINHGDGRISSHQVFFGWNTIGRELNKNSIVVPNIAVSAVHGLIYVGSDYTTITDLGSTNGVFLGNLETKLDNLHEFRINEDDVFFLGGIECDFEADQILAQKRERCRLGKIVEEFCQRYVHTRQQVAKFQAYLNEHLMKYANGGYHTMRTSQSARKSPYIRVLDDIYSTPSKNKDSPGRLSGLNSLAVGDTEGIKTIEYGSDSQKQSLEGSKEQKRQPSVLVSSQKSPAPRTSYERRKKQDQTAQLSQRRQGVEAIEYQTQTQEEKEQEKEKEKEEKQEQAQEHEQKQKLESQPEEASERSQQYTRERPRKSKRLRQKTNPKIQLHEESSSEDDSFKQKRMLRQKKQQEYIPSPKSQKQSSQSSNRPLGPPPTYQDYFKSESSQNTSYKTGTTKTEDQLLRASQNVVYVVQCYNCQIDLPKSLPLLKARQNSQKFDILVISKYERRYILMVAVLKGCDIVNTHWTKKVSQEKKLISFQKYRIKLPYEFVPERHHQLYAQSQKDILLMSVEKARKGHQVFKNKVFVLQGYGFKIEESRIEKLIALGGGSIYKHKRTTSKNSKQSQSEENSFHIVSFTQLNDEPSLESLLSLSGKIKLYNEDLLYDSIIFQDFDLNDYLVTQSFLNERRHKRRYPQKNK